MDGANVDFCPIFLGSKQVKCPNTPLEKKCFELLWEKSILVHPVFHYNVCV